MATDTFEELGLDPALVEALGAEGIERPTAFQVQALPLIRRGNNVVGRAGPGAGTLVGYGAPLLDRLGGLGDEGDEGDEPGHGPLALVLTPSAAIAGRLATSLARLAGMAQVGELRVAALGGPWVLPERADILFASADEALALVREGRLSLGGLRAVVVEQLTALTAVAGEASLETLFDFLPGECQRVVLELPSRDGDQAVEDFADRHLKRAVHVPPRAVEEDTSRGPDRGEVRYRIVADPMEGGVRLVSELLYEPDVRHLVVFFRNEDRAADVGDHLTLHGYVAGAPGDADVPVWLAVDELEARAVLDAFADSADGSDEGALTVLSWDVPADPDSLDRRHGAGRGGHVLCLPREMPHLRDVARRTGYRVKPNPPGPEERIKDDLVQTVERIETALEEEDIGSYLLVLETLFEGHDPAEVAAAAVALLRKKVVAAVEAPGGRAAATVPSSGTPAGARGPAWVRLFITLGTKDNARPGDVVGAITGEAGIDGSQVGKIELRDSFSIVEVEESVAERVIGALNGTTVRGRSLRVDYDRASRRPSGGGRKEGGGGGGGRRRSPGGPGGGSGGSGRSAG